MSYQAKFPSPSTPFVDLSTGQINQQWQYLLVQLYQRTGGAAGSTTAYTPLKPTGSPFSYTANSVGNFLITGGTVTSASMIRNGVTLAIPNSGFIPLSAGDSVKITYSVPPTLTFVQT